MAYVSPDTRNFYLSRHACIQLSVIPKDFPKVGSADVSTIEHSESPMRLSYAHIATGSTRNAPIRSYTGKQPSDERMVDSTLCGINI